MKIIKLHVREIEHAEGLKWGKIHPFLPTQLILLVYVPLF